MDLSSLATYHESSFSSENYSFTSELDLVDEFELALVEKNQDNSHIEREFNGGFGVADAVLFSFSSKKFAEELAMIEPEWAYTLRMLPYRKNFSIEELQKLSGASVRSCQKAIGNFIDSGFCKRKGKDKFIKEFQPKSFIKKSIAVEAKLKNWKRALFQASRYKTFCNQSWVLLDNYYCRPAIQNIENFKLHKVGLASFSTSGELVCHYSPPEEKYYSDIAYWRANVLLSKMLLCKRNSMHGI